MKKKRFEEYGLGFAWHIPKKDFLRSRGTYIILPKEVVKRMVLSADRYFPSNIPWEIRVAFPFEDPFFRIEENDSVLHQAAWYYYGPKIKRKKPRASRSR